MIGGCIAKCTRVDFDHVGVYPVGHLDLVKIRIDEYADHDACVFECFHRLFDGRVVVDQVKATLCCELFSFFRHKGYRVGL